MPEKQSVEVEGRRLALSNLDKVLYPADPDDQGRGDRLLRPDRPARCCRTCTSGR